MSVTPILKRIIFYENYVTIMSLEKSYVQRISYPISYNQLEGAYNHINYYYEGLKYEDDFWIY